MKIFLAFRALFFVAIFPGVVAGYIPYRMLLTSNGLPFPVLNVASTIAGILILLGTLILLRCVWDFFARGQGTLAPVDPPRHLVVSGLYRFTRNPMYNGVIIILFGETWYFGSTSLLIYAICVLVAFHLIVVLYEEPILESKFHESYHAYRKAVPRWGFTTHPYHVESNNTA